MTSTLRRFINSPVSQGQDEVIAYTVDTSKWQTIPDGVPSDPIVKLYEVTNGTYTDVSNTHLSGSPTLNGSLLTTKTVHDLVAGHQYRLEVSWKIGSYTLEAFGDIYAER